MHSVQTEILVGLNEVQQDLGLHGDHETSEKIRDIKKRVEKIHVVEDPQALKLVESLDVDSLCFQGGAVTAILDGLRNNAIDHCHGVAETLEKVKKRDSYTDNELMYIKLAAGHLYQQIGDYLQKKMMANCS